MGLDSLCIRDSYFLIAIFFTYVNMHDRFDEDQKVLVRTGVCA